MGQNSFFKISITVFIRLNAAAFINLFIKFRDSSAVFIRGRRLFKIQFISCKQQYGNWLSELKKKKETCCLSKKSLFISFSISQFVCSYYCNI